jgi:hypothetical protein
MATVSLLCVNQDTIYYIGILIFMYYKIMDHLVGIKYAVYTQEEAQQLLHITHSTLLTYRKTGNKVWFTQADLDLFLGKNQQYAFYHKVFWEII